MSDYNEGYAAAVLEMSRSVQRQEHLGMVRDGRDWYRAMICLCDGMVKFLPHHGDVIEAINRERAEIHTISKGITKLEAENKRLRSAFKATLVVGLEKLDLEDYPEHCGLWDCWNEIYATRNALKGEGDD